MKNTPSINDMLSSLIRLMSNYAYAPHETQVMTLLRLLDQLKGHPDYERNQVVRVAVEHAKVIWADKMQELRANSSCVCHSTQEKRQLH